MSELEQSITNEARSIFNQLCRIPRVTKGNLRTDSLRVGKRKDGRTWVKGGLPMYALNKSGEVGPLLRTCTYDYKISQIQKAVRKFKPFGIVQWIGISVDEVSRMKDSVVPWIENRWPLVDLRMSRWDCLRWMESNGYPKPPRSACTFCPFHSDSEWTRLRNEEPEAFEDAVSYEREVQSLNEHRQSSSTLPFLHRSCVPLNEVDFSTEEERGQLNMFNNECEGMCGV